MARLTPEQRAELERQLKEDDEAEDDFEIEIGNASGEYARVPYRKGKGFLARFGLDADDLPKQDPEGAPEDKPKGKQGGQQGGNVRAFGRTVRGA